MTLTLTQVLESLSQTMDLPYIYIDDNNHIISYSNEQELTIYNESLLTRNIIQETFNHKKNYYYIDDSYLSIATIYIHHLSHIILIGMVFLEDRLNEKIEVKVYSNHQNIQEILTYMDTIHILDKNSFFKILNYLSYLCNNEEYFHHAQKYAYIDNNRNIDYVSLDNTSKGSFKHSAYAFEKQLYACIQQGNIEGLNKILNVGKEESVADLAVDKSVKRNLKNQFIAACTLATRSAMEGGLYYEIAYTLSDYYINLVENSESIAFIQKQFNQMFLNFTIRVSRLHTNNTYSKNVQSIISYVNNNIMNPINIDHLAKHMNMSKEYLYKIFKNETGTSLIDYIHETKINEATLLLQYSNLSIIEISNMLCYSSQSYFSSIFKKYKSMTPKQYRDQCHH